MKHLFNLNGYSATFAVTIAGFEHIILPSVKDMEAKSGYLKEKNKTLKLIELETANLLHEEQKCSNPEKHNS